MTTNRSYYDHDIHCLSLSTPARPQCLCWTSIVMIFLMMCVLVALCQYTANRWKKQDPQVHSNTARYALVVRTIYEREHSRLILYDLSTVHYVPFNKLSIYHTVSSTIRRSFLSLWSYWPASSCALLSSSGGLSTWLSRPSHSLPRKTCPDMTCYDTSQMEWLSHELRRFLRDIVCLVSLCG